MLKKVKILVSLFMIMLVVWTAFSDSSFATDITANTSANNTLVITTITASPVNNTANTANKVTNTNVTTISGTVNTVKNTTNTNSSRYETTNSTKLPYAGSNTSIIFVVLAFVASAAYAYKKVSEYNV